MLIWFVVPWAIMTFIPQHKCPEYYLGIVPVIILMISVFIANIKKNILLIFVIFICLLQYFNFSYGINNKKVFNLSINYKNYDICYYNKNYFFNVPVEKSYFEIIKHLELFPENIVYFDSLFVDIDPFLFNIVEGLFFLNSHHVLRIDEITSLSEMPGLCRA